MFHNPSYRIHNEQSKLMHPFRKEQMNMRTRMYICKYFDRARLRVIVGGSICRGVSK